jgi:type 1 secretion C-terminal target domain (VC_A0849 subclass)
MSTDTNLMRAQPTMDNPTVIDLSKTGGQNYWHFSDKQDVIFLGDTTHVRTDKLQVDGGHNVVVLGGEYQPTTAPTGTLAFRGAAGTVFVDGVHIDNSKSSGTDGIVISGGAKTSFVVQSSIIENVNGAKGGGQAAKGNGHADAIQIQGDLGGEVLLHNVHATTNYQGLFLAPQYAIRPSQVTLDNVDLHYTGAANDGSQTSYLLWSNDDPSQQAHVPWSFHNVYVQPRDGQQAIESAVWPKSGMGAVQNGNQISWPDMPYKGSVTIGNHSSFVDATKIGLHFNVANANPNVATGTTSPAESAPPTHWIKSTDPNAHVTGTAGNDQIAGVQKAADVGGMEGGKGDDTYTVGDANDKVIEHANEGVDTVLSYAPSYTLPANVENLVLGTGATTGIGNDGSNRIVGNDGANVLKGGAGDDLLIGGKGADHLDGGSGANVMKGGAGGDTYIVHSAKDVVIENAGEGVDTVKSDISYTLGTYAENLMLNGNGKANINGTGNAWHNAMTGNDGDNVLKGMAGNDVLSGGAHGNDVLIGGTGNDTFVLKAAGAGLDTIKDFKVGEDTLNVQALLKSIGASSAAQAIHDHMLNVVQHGANAEVSVKVAGHDVKVAVVDNVDAAALIKTADHWL